MSDDANDVNNALAAFGAPPLRYHTFSNTHIRPSRIVLSRNVVHAPVLQPSPHASQLVLQSEPIAAPEPVSPSSQAVAHSPLTEGAVTATPISPAHHEPTSDTSLVIPEPPDLIVPPAVVTAASTPGAIPPTPGPAHPEPQSADATAFEPHHADAAVALSRAPSIPGPDGPPPPDRPPPLAPAAMVTTAVAAVAGPRLIAATPDRVVATKALENAGPLSEPNNKGDPEMPSHTLSELFAFLADTPALTTPPAVD